MSRDSVGDCVTVRGFFGDDVVGTYTFSALVDARVGFAICGADVANGVFARGLFRPLYYRAVCFLVVTYFADVCAYEDDDWERVDVFCDVFLYVVFDGACGVD